MRQIKILILLSLFLGTICSGNAATNDNITVTEGKIWNYTEVYTTVMGEVSTYEYPGFHFSEQKELNGKAYTAFMDGKNRVYAYLRQEGPRVYIAGEKLKIVSPSTDGFLEKDEYLLYDFSLNPGDRFETLGFDYVGWHEDSEIRGYQHQAEVLRTYEKEINGITYNYQEYGYNIHSESTYNSIITIIEGIGPQTGYVCFPGVSQIEPVGWYGTSTTYLTSVTTKDGEMLWDDTSGVESVEADTNQSTDGAIYDLCGRRVVNPLPGTIYIRDGRKFVAR